MTDWSIVMQFVLTTFHLRSVL